MEESSTPSSGKASGISTPFLLTYFLLNGVFPPSEGFEAVDLISPFQLSLFHHLRSMFFAQAHELGGLPSEVRDSPSMWKQLKMATPSQALEALYLVDRSQV
ncbi:hypothetical protein ACJRO7_026580 [Eucalyptus globulus]|uniref:Uncharacterized protein n=1 Tax=Eucalyptus globulus TaxID=34317 RepID=A0ABD3K152_EUCGL